jgi:hypothetical protein
MVIARRLPEGVDLGLDQVGQLADVGEGVGVHVGAEERAGCQRACRR